MTTSATKIKIGFIHNAFPVLSETFISKEMRGLQSLGVDLQIYSLFRPKADRLDVGYPDGDDVRYVLDPLRPRAIVGAHFYFIVTSPLRYMRTLIFALRSRTCRSSFLKTLFAFAARKEISKERRQDMLLHFILAAPLARRMQRDQVTFINSHFVDAAAGFALLISKIIGLPFGVTAHAYDIFTPQYNLQQKIEAARFMLTCTRYNKKSLLDMHPEIAGEKIHVFYHGIDTDRFERQARQSNAAAEILAVGRLTPKKGFDVLLNACAILAAKGVKFSCRIIGDGEQKQELQRLAMRLHLTEIVDFVGAVASANIKPYYERADIFVLPCVIDKDGNRDGIPNVIAEAMAMELPVVSSNISGIPELVQNKETGFLLEQHDVAGVADAVERLINDPTKRLQMGKNGRKRVLSIFDSRVCLQNLYTFYVNELSNGDQATWK